MKISANIICKNESSCILDCLESVRELDEIIVCDTGSTDNTLELISSFEHPNLKIFEYKWDDHFADARNFCYSKSAGDWCIVIDSDETLDEGSYENLKKEIEKNKKAKTLKFQCASKGSLHSHWMVRAYKNCKEVKWVRRIHEHLIPVEDFKAEGCGIHYGYSEAHNLDPNRSFRILWLEYLDSKLIGKEPEERTLYYLAREYFYKKDWKNSLKYFLERTRTMGFKPECSDAWLYVAKCQWNLERWEEARESALKSILLNPNFKEAHLFIAERSFEKQKEVWKKFAEIATNEDCLFIRG